MHGGIGGGDGRQGRHTPPLISLAKVGRENRLAGGRPFLSHRELTLAAGCQGRKTSQRSIFKFSSGPYPRSRERRSGRPGRLLGEGGGGQRTDRSEGEDLDKDPSPVQPHPRCLPGLQHSGFLAASACCSHHHHQERQQRHWLVEICSRGSSRQPLIPLPSHWGGAGQAPTGTSGQSWAPLEAALRLPPPKGWRGEGEPHSQGLQPGGRKEPARVWARQRIRPGDPGPPFPSQRKIRPEHEQSVSLNINRTVVWNSNESNLNTQQFYAAKTAG